MTFSYMIIIDAHRLKLTSRHLSWWFRCCYLYSNNSLSSSLSTLPASLGPAQSLETRYSTLDCKMYTYLTMAYFYFRSPISGGGHQSLSVNSRLSWSLSVHQSPRKRPEWYQWNDTMLLMEGIYGICTIFFSSLPWKITRTLSPLPHRTRVLSQRCVD